MLRFVVFRGLGSGMWGSERPKGWGLGLAFEALPVRGLCTYIEDLNPMSPWALEAQKAR